MKVGGEGALGMAPMEGPQRWREMKEGPKDFYKTKLCEKYATLGRCPYDERCTYAHGYAARCLALNYCDCWRASDMKN